MNTAEIQSGPVLNLPTRRTFLYIVGFVIAIQLFFTADLTIGAIPLTWFYPAAAVLVCPILWCLLIAEAARLRKVNTPRLAYGILLLAGGVGCAVIFHFMTDDFRLPYCTFCSTNITINGVLYLFLLSYPLMACLSVFMLATWELSVLLYRTRVTQTAGIALIVFSTLLIPCYVLARSSLQTNRPFVDASASPTHQYFLEAYPFIESDALTTHVRLYECNLLAIGCKEVYRSGHNAVDEERQYQVLEIRLQVNPDRRELYVVRNNQVFFTYPFD